MLKMRVKFVKYDLTKTKNRKRSDMLVEGKTEKAVKAQLEKIHKGEQVTAIHEIIWDENQIEEVVNKDLQDQENFFLGTVKFFDAVKEFGFIQADEEMDDLFFHTTACIGGTPGDKDRVEFKISKGPKGMLATSVKIVND